LLANNKISAVLVSTDLDKCQDFYQNKLGLKPSKDTVKNHLVFEGHDGTTILIYKRPSDNQADHTQVRFWTKDIEADVKDLAGRGVVFEEYNNDFIKTIDHIATSAGLGKSAWFKDPDGNTLALFQPE
jgi:catechol 2,3-dioxygenase-like lactoylglutathione lyase family enzyme